MTIPTLDQIAAYDPQHLVSAATHWDETAQLWEDTLGEFHASAQGLDFHGRTAEAVRDSAARQHQGAVTDADKLRQAAAIASNAADELRQGRQRVLDLVRHATDNEFMVSPTYQVTDTSGSHNADSAARQMAAQEMSADMVRFAGELYAHDADTAGRMAQAVDFKTDKGHIDHGQCDDPDYQSGIERRLLGAIGIGAITGGVVANIPGAITGGAVAGIGDLLHEISGDGPSCQ
jgi:hypothetical protein